MSKRTHTDDELLAIGRRYTERTTSWPLLLACGGAALAMPWLIDAAGLVPSDGAHSDGIARLLSALGVVTAVGGVAGVVFGLLGCARAGAASWNWSRLSHHEHMRTRRMLEGSYVPTNGPHDEGNLS